MGAVIRVVIESKTLDVKTICKARRIRKINIETPLLIPSFSSAVSEIKVKEFHERVSDYLPHASLVSAYDIKYFDFNADMIWVSDVVIIDSGNHEVGCLKEARSKNLEDWSDSIYSKVISTLNPLTKIIIVNYDEKKELKKQISEAKKFFSNYTNYASCFLCKPPSDSVDFVDISGLIENITEIEPFDVLGITEKELGSSLFTRCRNLLRIRNALNIKDLTIPIHIFGCLDPLNIISYFLCGADMFDGTIWLKFGFNSNLAIYLSNLAYLNGSWSEPDSNVRASSCSLNLASLTKLMYKMRRFTYEYDFNLLGLEEHFCNQVKDLTETAGLKY